MRFYKINEDNIVDINKVEYIIFHYSDYYKSYVITIYLERRHDGFTIKYNDKLEAKKAYLNLQHEIGIYN
jgi:hypothetical protein